MATVKAEQLAVEALREYLLRTLPGKVSSINTGRAAVLKAAVAGAYAIPASGTLKIGTAPGSETTVALTSGSRTAAQVASEISVAGITATADAQSRLVLTATAAPSGTTPSVVVLAADSTATNSVFGWDAGGERVYRYPLAAPAHGGIVDGDHAVLDLRAGFGILFLDKRSEDTLRNIRHDERDVTIKMALHVPVPGGHPYFAAEQVEQAVRAVREVLFEDRTLDSQVQMLDVMNATILGPVFRFEGVAGVSPLLARADMAVRVRIFERS